MNDVDQRHNTSMLQYIVCSVKIVFLLPIINNAMTVFQIVGNNE